MEQNTTLPARASLRILWLVISHPYQPPSLVPCENRFGNHNPYHFIKRSIVSILTNPSGTFILIMFGDGVVAQVVLSGGANGEYQSITWGWGYVSHRLKTV